MTPGEDQVSDAPLTRLMVALTRSTSMRCLIALMAIVTLNAALTRSAEPIDEKRVASLIRDLDADSFRLRDKAERDPKKRRELELITTYLQNLSRAAGK